MITDFQGFGLIHILSILTAAALGAVWIIWGQKAIDPRQRTICRLTLAALIIIIRAARWVMDAYFGVFTWSDVLSLHICNIDLFLLIICLIKPNRPLFSFCFIIGIPFALSVALFPGSTHPAPGVPRAVLFIMSHTMLAMGAVFLAVTEHMKVTLRSYLWLAALGNACLIPLYFLNNLLGTNYLYINFAPKGTALASAEKIFGWPGYVLALDALALILMLLMFLISRLLWRLSTRENNKSAQGIKMS